MSTFSDTIQGKLYIVATPIGNLEDVTLRALRVLKEADIILCEDTRMTQRLLKHYGIAGKRLAAYNEQRSGVRAEKVIAWLEQGKNIALVSDAGTPAISDPGALLVSQIRDYLVTVKDKGLTINVVPIPGPSAVVVALSASGFPSSDFLFLGFLPHKKGRETLFREIAASPRTTVFYESPHRVAKALASLQRHVGGERRIAVARELTKVHEEIFFGSINEALVRFGAAAERTRGEFTVVVGPVHSKGRDSLEQE